MVPDDSLCIHDPTTPLASFPMRLTALPTPSPKRVFLRWGSVLHVPALSVLAMLMLATAARGADPAAKPLAPDRHPELKRLSPTEEVWIDAKQKRVVVGGEIAIDKGPIEYFACPHGTKEHESIVSTRSTARLVHVALLAIGLVPGKPVSFDPDYVAATGPVVRVMMRWKDAAGTVHELPAQEWIRDNRTGKPMQEQWVFAGSAFWTDPSDGKEYYQADGGDLVCLSNFPTAMLDLPIESSQSNEALLFDAFDGRVPPRGTAVEMIFSSAPPAGK